MFHSVLCWQNREILQSSCSPFVQLQNIGMLHSWSMGWAPCGSVQLPQLFSNDSVWPWIFKNSPTLNFCVQSPSLDKSSLAISCSWPTCWDIPLNICCSYPKFQLWDMPGLFLLPGCPMSSKIPAQCRNKFYIYIFNTHFSSFLLSSLANHFLCKDVWKANQSCFQCYPALAFCSVRFSLWVCINGLIFFMGHTLQIF